MLLWRSFWTLDLPVYLDIQGWNVHNDSVSFKGLLDICMGQIFIAEKSTNTNLDVPIWDGNLEGVAM